MGIALYFATALGLVALAHRLVTAMSVRAALVLLLLPLAFTGRGLVGDRVYGPIDHPYQWEPLRSLAPQYGIGAPHNAMVTDVYSQMFPWRRAVQQSLAEGRWPLWNPWILEGHLLAGAGQPAAVSPFTLIACLLPAAKSFAFTAAIGFFIAGASSFLFTRELGCSEAASLLAATGYTFSTVVALYILWPHGFAWCWFPLVLLAARRVAQQPGVASGALLVAALTLLMLSGHPETAFHCVVLASLYAMLHVQRWPHALGFAFGAGIVTLLLCAIYLLPLIEAIPQTAEYEYKKATAIERGESAGTPGKALLTDVFPSLYRRKWTDSGALGGETAAPGSIVLALAIVAMTRKRSRETWFFALGAVVCAVIAAGWRPANILFAHLPLFDIAHNERLVFATVFFACALAAIGYDTMTRYVPLIVVLAAIVIGIAVTSRFVTVDPPDWGRYKALAEIVGLATATLIVALNLPRQLLLVVLLVQRVVADGGALKTFPAAAAYPPLHLLDAIRSTSPPFRIVGAGLTFIPGTNVFYGLEDARGYEAMTFSPLGATYRLWCQHQPVWFNRVDDLTRPFLSMLNVRYAIADRAAPVPPGWRVISAQNASVLLENEHFIERAFIPRTVTLSRQEGDSFVQNGATIQAMEKAGDFRDRAWIRADVTDVRQLNGRGTVRIMRYRAGEYEIDARMENNGWIVISDCAWKGWRAYIDGRRVQMHRANIAFNAIHVPRGVHHLRVIYFPASFVIGRAISVVMALLLAVSGFLRAMRRPKPPLTSALPSPSSRG